MVGEAMEQFTMEVIDYMEWDTGSDQFIKTSPPLSGGAGQGPVQGSEEFPGKEGLTMDAIREVKANKGEGASRHRGNGMHGRAGHR